MKKVFLYSSLIVTSLAVAGSTTTAVASERTNRYESATEVNADAKIKFIEGDPDIVDPGDPDKLVVPEDELNPHKDSDLRIQYISDFDFGVRKRVANEVFTANAKAVEVKPKAGGAGYNVVPFVSTLDLRADRGKGWSLKVSQDSFTTKENGAEVDIKGAEIIFSNATYKSQAEAPTIVAKATTAVDYDTKVSNYSGYLTALDNAFQVPTSSQKIASATAKVASDPTSVDTGAGSYSLGLGTGLVEDQNDVKEGEPVVKHESTNGVTFRMPKRTGVRLDSTYHATLTWVLQPEV